MHELQQNPTSQLQGLPEPIGVEHGQPPIAGLLNKSADVAPRWGLTGLSVLGWGLLSLIFYHLIEIEGWWIPGLSIAFSGALLIPAFIRSLRRSPEHAFSDHFLILSGAFFLYSVLGALLLPIGPEVQAEAALSYFPIDAQEALRVIALNCIGFGIALISGSLVPPNRFSGLAARAVELGNGLSTRQVILLFLAVGGFGLASTLPYDLGIREGVSSGMLRQLERLLCVAILLLTAHRKENAKLFLVLGTALTVFLFALGVFLLGKAQALFPVAALVAGLWWRYRSSKIILFGGVMILLLFQLIGEPVANTRNVEILGERADYQRRVDTLLEESSDPTDTSYNTWARFCYLPPQAAAVALYDGGQSGTDWGLVLWTLVPRFIFSNKPVMTANNRDFHYKISGSDGSATGRGVFIDGYYNLGGIGLVVVSVATGVFLGLTSILASAVFLNDRKLWLPLALLGSNMAFRIDGDFLADYLGSFVILMYAVTTCLILRAVLPRSRISHVPDPIHR